MHLRYTKFTDHNLVPWALQLLIHSDTTSSTGSWLSRTEAPLMARCKFLFAEETIFRRITNMLSLSQPDCHWFLLCLLHLLPFHHCWQQGKHYQQRLHVCLKSCNEDTKVSWASGRSLLSSCLRTVQHHISSRMCPFISLPCTSYLTCSFFLLLHSESQMKKKQHLCDKTYFP